VTIVLGLLLCFFILYAVLRFTSEPMTKPGTAAYRREQFMSDAEVRFYKALQGTVGARACIFVKPRLNDLVSIVDANRSNWQTVSNKLRMKHVDFLLCDPVTLTPLCAVELDDGTHARGDRQARDKFVNETLAAAGIPIEHFAVRSAYPAAEIFQKLAQIIPGWAAPQADAGKPVPQAEAAAPAKPALPAKSPAAPVPAAPPQPKAHKDLKYMPPAMRAAMAAKLGPVAPAVEPTPPVCPHCNKPMVLRTPSRGDAPGSKFWGCINYPTCHETLPFAQE